MCAGFFFAAWLIWKYRESDSVYFPTLLSGDSLVGFWTPFADLPEVFALDSIWEEHRMNVKGMGPPRSSDEPRHPCIFCMTFNQTLNEYVRRACKNSWLEPSALDSKPEQEKLESNALPFNFVRTRHAIYVHMCVRSASRRHLWQSHGDGLDLKHGQRALFHESECIFHCLLRIFNSKAFK